MEMSKPETAKKLNALPPNFFPSLDEVSKPLPREELDILARQFHKEDQFVSLQTRFNYAWGLIKSEDSGEQRQGVKFLTEIFKDGPERRRECLYYLAAGHYKLGEYTLARKYLDILLSYEPNNSQIIEMRQAVEDRLNMESSIGIVIVGAVAAVGAALLGALLRRKR